MTAPVYNDANFRAQFPAFASEAAYPETALQFAWNMGASWVSQTQAIWGVGSNNPNNLQMAADLMGAVIVRNLFGPTAKGTQTPLTPLGAPSPLAVAAGPVTSAADGGTSASVKLPEFGSSAFSALLLSSPPYGTLLLSLLKISAAGGPYIPSCRSSFVPP